MREAYFDLTFFESVVIAFKINSFVKSVEAVVIWKTFERCWVTRPQIDDALVRLVEELLEGHHLLALGAVKVARQVFQLLQHLVLRVVVQYKLVQRDAVVSRVILSAEASPSSKEHLASSLSGLHLRDLQPAGGLSLVTVDLGAEEQFAALG